MIHDTRYKIRNKSQQGFIALMSAIVIAGVLMAIVFTMSFKIFTTRFNILEAEYKRQSFNLAEGYVSNGILKLIEGLAQDPSYTGETIAVGGADYYEIAVSGTSVTIEAHSVVEEATSNIQLSGTYSGGALTINSWKEVPSL